MAQVNIKIRMEEDLIKSMETTCHAWGLDMNTAFIIFAKKVVREYRIPFEISEEPNPRRPGCR